MHSFHGRANRVAEAGGLRAALVLRPVANNDHWLDFRHTGKIHRRPAAMRPPVTLTKSKRWCARKARPHGTNS